MPIETKGGRVTGRGRAAVIGSGFGGLAAAIRLQAAGCRTTIYERNAETGGRAGTFSVDGFRFDRGPTVVTAPGALEELFQLAGRRLADYVDLVPVDPMYRLHWEDGSRFDYSTGGDALLAEIGRLAPGDVAGYQRFYRYAREVFETGYVKLCHVPFRRVTDMLRVAPALVRLKAHVPVYRTVSRYFKDERLRQAFSFNSLLIGGNPLRASSIYTLIHPLEREWGVTFPRGGMGALVDALARLFVELGGDLRLSAPVDHIVTAGRRVTGVALASGEVVPADVIISNADVLHTYRQLLRHEPAARGPARRLARRRFSMSLFVVYFGTRKAYPGLLHHNVMFGNRYRGLLTDIFDRGIVADDFSLYVHAPTLTDPSLAPPGCHAYYALAPVPHLGHRSFDWRRDGDAYADKILAYLDRHYMPGLSGDVVVRRTLTPEDFAERLGAHLGNAFSLEPTLRQSAYFRVHNQDRRITGLYFVGAGTHPGAGIPGVIGSAKATAGLILGASPTLTEQCKATMRAGSLTFFFASRLLGARLRGAVILLYAWCRFCDDAVDDDDKDPATRRRPEERALALDELRRATWAAIHLPPRQLAARPGPPALAAFAALAARYRIPDHYPQELLAGMEMDLAGHVYASFEDLRLYGYRVAGTVGLMFCHLAGVSDPLALRHAANLGIAMQLTNIARDVREDFAMGRVYLPADWLAAEGLTASDVGRPECAPAVARVVARLLAAAGELYRSGDEGLEYLPLAAAFAVAAARHIYAGIGDLVARRGAAAWDARAVVPLTGKVRLAGRGIAQVLRLAARRLPWFAPFKPVRLTTIWRCP